MEVSVVVNGSNEKRYFSTKYQLKLGFLFDLSYANDWINLVIQGNDEVGFYYKKKYAAEESRF